MDEEENIVVLAGNPRIEQGKEGIIIDSQITAFEEAIRFASRISEKGVRVVVFFDHLGKFEESFLDERYKNDTSHQRRKAAKKLASLPENIRKQYKEITEMHNFNFENIEILSESVCRMRMNQLAKEDAELFAPMLRENSCGSDLEKHFTKKKFGINCRGIFAGIIYIFSQYANDIRCFWEFHQHRCNPLTIHNGIEFARKNMGVQANIESMIIWAEENKRKIFYYPVGREFFIKERKSGE